MKKFARFTVLISGLLVLQCSGFGLYNVVRSNISSATDGLAGATIAAVTFLFGLALGGGDVESKELQ